MTSTIPPRQHALNRLSRSECSASDMKKYLKRKGVEESEIEDVLVWLKEQNFIDDERYAKVMVRSQSLRGKGPNAIRMKLMQKGVRLEPKKVKALYGELASRSESEAAREIVERRYPEAYTERKEAARALQALLRRGFSYDAAKEAISPPKTKS